MHILLAYNYLQLICKILDKGEALSPVVLNQDICMKHM